MDRLNVRIIRTWTISLSLIFVITLFSCKQEPPISYVPRPCEPKGFVRALSEASLEQTKSKVRYDASYRKIDFPNGDVPADTGVCADVIVRSYRKLGIDLQKEMNDEMNSDFDAFPKKWGLKAPDTNIDHRRVPNLQVFFTRRGLALPVTKNAQDYQPGDIVTWSVWGKPHTGIVVDRPANNRKCFMVVHNIGRGPELEDMLFDYPIKGHYRYYSKYSVYK